MINKKDIRRGLLNIGIGTRNIIDSFVINNKKAVKEASEDAEFHFSYGVAFLLNASVTPSDMIGVLAQREGVNVDLTSEPNDEKVRYTVCFDNPWYIEDK